MILLRRSDVLQSFQVNALHFLMIFIFIHTPQFQSSIPRWSMSQKNVAPFAPNARSIPCTKLLSTRLVRRRTLLKERDVTTLSKWVLVVKRSLSSTKRRKPLVRLCSVLNARNVRRRSNLFLSARSILSSEPRRQSLAISIRKG